MLNKLFVWFVLTSQFSADGCGKTKGCFFKPESCKSAVNKCEYFMTYKPQGSTITFELSSNTKWAAVGFNHKAVMVIITVF